MGYWSDLSNITRARNPSSPRLHKSEETLLNYLIHFHIMRAVNVVSTPFQFNTVKPLAILLSCFLPSSILMLCAIQQPHLEGRDPIWGDDWSHSLHRRSPSWGFPGFFLSYKVNSSRSVHNPRYHLIITLSLGDRADWHNTLDKRPLARNPERSWWHRHTSLKFFWPQPMAPWTAGF